jgi:hypothetical protein
VVRSESRTIAVETTYKVLTALAFHQTSNSGKGVADMKTNGGFTRRQFMAVSGTTVGAIALGRLDVQQLLASPVTTPHADMDTLRQDIVNSPVRVGLHRAEVFTRVFRKTEGKPWVLRKALAMREYFRTVPLYLRDHDCLAGSISEMPGAMPVIVELGIGENGIYTSERPDRKGYLKGQVPEDIREYWMNRNALGAILYKDPGVEVL